MPYDIVTGAMDDDLRGLLEAESGRGPIDIVGAEGPADPAMAQQILSRNAAVIKRDPNYVLREYPLGFDSETAVGAAVQVSITTQPQIPFKVERLVVPSDIAGSFVVDELVVGKNPQLAANVAVPARVFDERAVGVRLRGDTAQVSQNVTLRVTNISGAAVRFRAAVIGASLD